MIKKNKSEEAFESYRYIITKGKNTTAMNIITMRSKALRPQPATTVKDVESCIVKWKSDLAYVDNVVEGYIGPSPDDRKSILVNMLPENLQLIMAPHLKTKKLIMNSKRS